MAALLRRLCERSDSRQGSKGCRGLARQSRAQPTTTTECGLKQPALRYAFGCDDGSSWATLRVDHITRQEIANLQFARCPAPNVVSHVLRPHAAGKGFRRSATRSLRIRFKADKRSANGLEFSDIPSPFAMAFFALCLAMGVPFFAYRAYVGTGNLYELIGFSFLSICCLFSSACMFLALPTHIAAALPVCLAFNRDPGDPQTVRKWMFKHRGLCPVRSMTCEISSLQLHRALAHTLGMQREFDQLVNDQARTVPLSGESDLDQAIAKWLDSDGNESLRAADFIHWGYALVAWCEATPTDSSIHDKPRAIPLMLSFATSLDAMESIVQDLHALLPDEVVGTLIDPVSNEGVMNRRHSNGTREVVVIEAC